MSRVGTVHTRFALVLVVTLGLVAAACGDQDDPPPGAPLTIGYLADFSGSFADHAPAGQAGVELALKHINEAGGVHGRVVSVVTGDTGGDPLQAVAEARRLLEAEGVHAIVGPPTSAATLALVERVTAPNHIPQISPSATAPALTTAADGGYLFRTIGSDAVQGIVLAQLVEREGHRNVAVIYRDDAWGRGLLEVFAAHYGGSLTTVSYSAGGQSSYLEELRQAASGGADVLVAMGFAESAVFLGESIEHGIFTRFILTDGNKSEELIAQVGAEHLEGAVGTVPGSDPDNASTRAWDAAYVAEHGALLSHPFVREAYDAVIAIALAAEAAGSTDGAAIRDQLLRVAGPPGDVYIAGASGVRNALAAAREGDDINYEGAATPIDWNEAGDVTSGFMEIFGIRDGRFVTIETLPFDLNETEAP